MIPRTSAHSIPTPATSSGHGDDPSFTYQPKKKAPASCRRLNMWKTITFGSTRMTKTDTCTSASAAHPSCGYRAMSCRFPSCFSFLPFRKMGESYHIKFIMSMVLIVINCSDFVFPFIRLELRHLPLWIKSQTPLLPRMLCALNIRTVLSSALLLPLIICEVIIISKASWNMLLAILAPLYRHFTYWFLRWQECYFPLWCSYRQW